MKALYAAAAVAAIALFGSTRAFDDGSSNAYGSDGSDVFDVGGETRAPSATQATAGSGSWDSYNWHWNVPTYAPSPITPAPTPWTTTSTATPRPPMDSSFSGSYSDDLRNDDDANVELYFPEIDGTLNAIKRHKHYFHPRDGFSISTSDATTGVMPGNCSSHAYCLHVVFESDYGAMSPFDAFYLDSYQSAHGSVRTDSFGGANLAPLVLGRFPKETIAKMGTNWSQVLNWDDPRRTTWTFYPTSDHPAEEIDLTFSLKQVYTALPDYIHRDDDDHVGPLYSNNRSDQVVIRVNAHLASGFASASAMLPSVVHQKGSQLVDINITTSLLFERGSTGWRGNDTASKEIQLTIKIGRRKYGGIAPWLPAVARSCFAPPSWFVACLDASSFSLRGAIEELLSYKNDRQTVDLRAVVKMCVAQATASASSSSSSSSSSPSSSSSSSSSSSDGGSMDDAGADSGPSLSMSGVSLMALDAALREAAFPRRRCPMNDIAAKSDGEGVLLHYQPSKVRIDFGAPQFSFYLVVEIGAVALATPIVTSTMTREAIAQTIVSAFPPEWQWLQLSVEFTNNARAVEDVVQTNRRIQDAYDNALRWSGTGASPSSSSFSSDGSTSSSSSSNVGEGDAGWESRDESTAGSATSASSAQLLPPPPQLLPVPAETHSVVLMFQNAAIVPRVKFVYSDAHTISFSTEDELLQLEKFPLLQMDVAYVAPPDDVDLEGRDEPGWKTKARKQLSKIPASDPCLACIGALEGCLLDEDCAFGVNSYFTEAMQWNRWTNYTTSSLDMSDVVRQARLFFPPRGFEKLQRLLLCWASSGCDLNEPRAPEFDSATGKWVDTAPVSRTVLKFQPTRIELALEQNRQFSLYHNGDKADQYMWSCEPWRLQSLVNTVLQLEPNYVRVVNMTHRCNDVFSNVWRFNLTWTEGFVEPIHFDVRDSSGQLGQSSLKARPWTLSVDESPKLPDGSLRDRAPWPRLLSWLGLFRSVPFGQIGGGGNATNATTDSSSSWSSSSSPSAVCPMCAPSLFACVSDSGCVVAARAWLAWALPLSNRPSFADWDGFHRQWWRGDPFSDAAVAQPYRERVVDFLACLSKHSCAVGYGQLSNATNTTVPTTVRLHATRKIGLVNGRQHQRVQLAYGDLVLGDLVPGEMPMALTKAMNDHDITVTAEYDYYRGMPTLNFSGSHEEVQRLAFHGIETEGYVLPVWYSAQFQSPAPRKPSWEYLNSWFRVAAAAGNQTTGSNTTTPTECADCVPKFQACYRDVQCWRSVQRTVVPILKRQLGSLRISVESLGDARYIYKAEIGSQLSQYAYQTGSWSNGNLFTTRDAWRAFTDILTCLAATACDVAAMDSAVEPPATAHVPSILKLQPARMTMLLYQDTTFQASLNGRSITYSHAGSTKDLESFLYIAFGNTSDVPFSIVDASEADSSGVFKYNVTFRDDFLAQVPYLSIIGSGQVPVSETMWFSNPYASSSSSRITIESMNQSPQWNKLLGLLSVSPLPAESTNVTSSDALSLALNSDCTASQIRYCSNDYSCSNLVANKLVPQLKHALRATPSYNPSTGLFEVDVTATMVSQVLWDGDSWSNRAMMEMLRQSTRCVSTAEDSSLIKTRPSFQNARIQFSRPAVGPLQVVYMDWATTVNDQDPTIDGRQQLASFLSNWFSTIELNWTLSDGQITYDIEIMDVFSATLPRLASLADMTPEPTSESSGSTDATPEPTLSPTSSTEPPNKRWLNSTSSPWRLGFQSESFYVYDAAIPWLMWLASQLRY